MDESSFLDDPELLSELAELGTFDDEPNKVPLKSPVKQAAAALARDTSVNLNDGTLELVPDEGSDDEDDDPSLRADLAILMAGSGASEVAGAPHSVASAAKPSSSSSVAKTASANKAAAAAAARKEAGAARATALGITQEAATALKLESFALNQSGDKAGAAAKFRAFKAMENELAASGSGGASSAPSGSASTSDDIPRMAPVAAASTLDHALQALAPPIGGPQDAVRSATESAMAAVSAAQSLLVDCEPTDGDGDDPELLGELSALNAQPASSSTPPPVAAAAASTAAVAQDAASAVAAKAGSAPPSEVTAEALAELQQKMFALNTAGKVREAGAVRKEFKKLEAQFKAQPPPAPAVPPAAPSAAATPEPTAAAPVNSDAPAAPVTTVPPAATPALPSPPADDMYVAPPAAAVLVSAAATATTTSTTVNSNRGEATETTQGSPGAAVALSPEVAQKVAQLKSMAQAQWRAGDKEAGRALLRQAKALETNGAATPPSSSSAATDAQPAAPQPPHSLAQADAPPAVDEAQDLRAQAVVAKEEAVAFHKAGKKEEARAALLRAKKLEASAAAATTAGATAGSPHLTAPSPSPSSQPSTAAATAGQAEGHAAGWDALEAALSNLIAERSARNADASSSSYNNPVGAAAGGGGVNSGSGNDRKGGEEWASASEECVALEALQAEVRARRRSNASGGEPAPQFTLGRGVVGTPRAVVVPGLKSDELQVTVFGLEDMVDYAGARLVAEVKMDSSLLLYEDEGSITFRAPNSEVVSSDGVCQFQSTANSKDNKDSSSGWCSSFTIKRSPRHARKYAKRACVEVAIMRESKSGWGPFSKTTYEPVAEAKCSLSGLLEKCSVNQLTPLHAVGHPRKAVRGRLSCLVRVHHPLGTTGNGTELRPCVGTTIALGPWGGGGVGTGPPAQALTETSVGAASSSSSSSGGGVAQRAHGVKAPVGLASVAGKGRAMAAGAAPGGRGGKGGGATKSASALSPEQTAQFAQLSTNEKRDPLSATLLVSEAVLEAELAKPNLEEMRRMTLNTQMYTLKVAIDAGQLSPDGYLANLGNRISRDMVLAKFLVFQQRRPEAANVLARVKVMKKEIEDVKAMLANQPSD